MNHLVLPKITIIWTNIKDWYCHVCDKTFHSKFGYTQHLYTFYHTTPPAYSNQLSDPKNIDNFCIACDKALSEKKVYFYHIFRYYLQDMSELYHGVDLKVPRKTDLQYDRYCHPCQKVFMYKVLYRVHLVKMHDTTLQGKLPVVDNENSFCAACDRRHTTRCQYRRHLIDIHCMDLPLIPKKLPTRNRVVEVSLRADEI